MVFVRVRSIFCLLLGACLPLFAGGDPLVRVLMVGDSWADFMWQDRTMRTTFAENGRPDIVEEGTQTAEAGTTAAEWVAPDRLATIDAELVRLPDLQVVQLTVGGNDILAGASGGGWHTGLTMEEEEQLFARVLGDVETVIDHILAADPDIQVLVSLYDYPNFEGAADFFCGPLHDDMGEPSPLQLNQLQTDFTERAMLAFEGRSRVHLVVHLGLMQFTYGFPDLDIDPGELAPPGRLDLPSPRPAMRFFNSDCIHLTSEGHRVVGQNLWDGFFVDFFCLLTEQIAERVARWPELTVVDLVADQNRACPPKTVH